MYYDLNVPEDLATSSYLKRLEDLGWNAVAINYTFAGKPPREPCSFKKLANLTKLRQYTRLTLVLNDPQQNVDLTKSNIINSFDLVAVRPTTEKTFQMACQSLNIDIISLDLSDRLSFNIRHGFVREAVARGVVFEVSYGPSIAAPIAGGKRRSALSSAMHLVRVMGKSKGVIVTSGPTVGEFCLRAPHCVRNWTEMVGIKADGSKACLVDNPYRVLRHAGDRKWSVRGSIVILSDEARQQNSNSDLYSDYIKMIQ